MLTLGALGIGAFNALLYTGLQTTTALNAMLLQAAQPSLILVMEAVMMKDRTNVPNRRCITISCGRPCDVSRGSPVALVSLSLNPSDAIISFAVLLWSI